MKIVDVSHNPRIPIFMEMAREMAAATEPEEILGAFSKALGLSHQWRGYVHLSTADLPLGDFRIIRFLNKWGEDLMTRADLGRNEAGIPVNRGGLFSELIQTQEPKLVHELDVLDDAVVGDRLSGVHSMLAIPMFLPTKTVDWIIGFHEEPEGFSDEDLAEMVAHVNMIGSKLYSTILAKEVIRVTARIQREVDEIAAIQRALLPRTMPDIPGLSLAANYETFDRAGGDYYDFIPLCAEGNVPGATTPWGIIIADASGHGPAAAVVVAMLHTLLHTYANASTNPVQLIEHINTNLKSNLIHRAFVTAFFGVYEPETRLLRYVRAGHDAPILMTPSRPEEMCRLDQAGGFPLGVSDRVESEEAAVELREGQTLVLYTDGITEARSPSGDLFRVEGIEQALITCNGDPDCVTLEVRDALKTHEAGVRPQDDQTIVALRVNGSS